ELERGVGISGHEHLLDAHGHRAMQTNDLADPAKHHLQPAGQITLAGADAARGDILASAPGIADHTVAGDARAGVDTEDQGHAGFSSMRQYTVYLSSREYTEHRAYKKAGSARSDFRLSALTEAKGTN